jgi:hypothetical protein
MVKSGRRVCYPAIKDIIEVGESQVKRIDNEEIWTRSTS